MTIPCGKCLQKTRKGVEPFSYLSFHFNCHISHYKLFKHINVDLVSIQYDIGVMWWLNAFMNANPMLQTWSSNLHCFINDRIVKLYTINIQFIINVLGNPTLNQCWSNSSIYPTSILCCINLNIFNNVKGALIQWVMSFKWCPHIESMVTIDYALIQCRVY
jgi:hypothetical protein